MCDDRCRDALGAICTCDCGGRYHGMTWRGTSAEKEIRHADRKKADTAEPVGQLKLFDNSARAVV